MGRTGFYCFNLPPICSMNFTLVGAADQQSILFYAFYDQDGSPGFFFLLKFMLCHQNQSGPKQEKK